MKRWIFKLVVFLLLGAIVNVAVAWACALWSPASYPGLIRAEADNAAARLMARIDIHPDHETAFMLPISSRTGMGLSEVASGVPTYGIRPPAHGTTRFAGWPFFSMVGSLIWDDDLNLDGETHGAIVVGRRPQDRYSRHEQQFLPVRPVWPGFAINTVFYAAILWLLALAPFPARRMIRHKRGLCIKCGYDLRGDVSAGCPECGWRRQG